MIDKQNKMLQIVIHGTALISVMGVSAILPVLPLMEQAFNLDKASLGWLISSFTIPGIFLAPLGGILADRLGRKHVLIPSLILFALAGVACSLATTLAQLIFFRIIQGCAAACFGVLYNIIIGDFFINENDRFRMMGFAAVSLSFGAAFYPAIGGLLGELGWHQPFLLTLLALPLAFIVWKTPLPKSTNKQSMLLYARNAKDVLLKPFTIGHYVLTLLAFIILYGPLITYFPLLIHDTQSASPYQIGLIFMLSSFGTIGAAFLISKLADKVSRRSMIATGGIFFTLAMMIFMQIDSLWLYIIPIFFYGLGQGLTYPAIIASLSAQSSFEGRGIIMAVNGSILRLAQSIAPLLCGIFYTLYGFDGVYNFGFLVACAITILALQLFKANNTIKLDNTGQES